MRPNILFFLLLAFSAVPARGQVSVTGPACVLPGITYQYLVSTPDTVGKGTSICLSGGAFSSGGACLNDSLVSSVLVVWGTDVANATVTFNSGSGSATANVSITGVLQPGQVDTASAQQTIGDSTSPAVIACPAATGGTCSPTYAYQWQQSADNVSWASVTGATNQNMDAAVTLTQTAYFRRMVTETTSGSIGYSTVAAVYVNPAQQ